MKFCRKCGNKVANEHKFCTSCGASLQLDEQQHVSKIEAQAEETNEAEPLNHVVKKKRWTIIVASLAFVLVLGGISWAFLGSSHGDAKMEYLKAESNTMKQAYKEWSNVYGDGFALADKMSKESYEQTLDLSASVSGDTIKNVELIEAILETLKLQIITKKDIENEQYEVGLNFIMNNENLDELGLFQSKEHYAIKLPFLNEPTYYYIENEKFGEMTKRIVDPAYYGPKNAKDLLDFKELFKTGLEKEYQDLYKDYGMFLFTELKEEHFNKNKNVQYGGKPVDKLTLTLTDKELKELITNLLNKVQNDDELLKVLLKKDRISLLTQTEAEYKQEFKKWIAEMKLELENINFGDGLVSTIYVSNEGLIVSRDFSLSVFESNGDNAVKISYIAGTKEADDLHIERKLSVKAGKVGDEGELVFKWKTMKKNIDTEESKIQTDMNLLFNEYGYETMILAFNMDTTRKQNEAVTNFTLASVEKVIENEDISISGQLTQKIDHNLVQNYANSEAQMSLMIKMDKNYDNPEIVTIHLNVDTKTDFTNLIDFPDLQSSARNLDEISRDEWESVRLEAIRNFEQLMYNTVGFGF